MLPFFLHLEKVQSHCSLFKKDKAFRHCDFFDVML